MEHRRMNRRKRELKDRALAIEASKAQNEKVVEVAQSLPGTIVSLNNRLAIDLSEDGSTDVHSVTVKVSCKKKKWRGIPSVERRWLVEKDIRDHEREKHTIKKTVNYSGASRQEAKHRIGEDTFIDRDFYEYHDNPEDAKEQFHELVPDDSHRDRCEYEWRDEVVMI